MEWPGNIFAAASSQETRILFLGTPPRCLIDVQLRALILALSRLPARCRLLRTGSFSWIANSLEDRIGILVTTERRLRTTLFFWDGPGLPWSSHDIRA